MTAPPARIAGLDLALGCTGYAIFEPSGKLITRGVIVVPKGLRDKPVRVRAVWIADRCANLVATRGVTRVFVEEPIAMAVARRGPDAQPGEQMQKMTSLASALAKGRLIQAVEMSIAWQTMARVDEIGIRRWRAILGLEQGPKAWIVDQLMVYLQQRGIYIPLGTRDDEVEACGVALAGVEAAMDPSMLLPEWKRKKPKKLRKAKEATAT